MCNRAMPVIECQLCGCLAHAELRCDGCRAFAYCTVEHKTRHWIQGHDEECSRMAKQMDRKNDVESVSGLWMESDLCDRLTAAGCHGKGPWRRECGCALDGQPFGSLANDGYWTPCNVAPGVSAEEVESWKGMCDCLGVPLGGALPLVLDYAATLFWAIKVCGIHPQPFQKHRIVIHVCGPEKELDQLCTFSILGTLMQKGSVHIYFVGPAIRQHNSAVLDGGVHIHLVPGLYHDVYVSLPPPDLTVAFNAGLAVYPSWMQTLQVVKESERTFFCTDYCEEAVFRSLSLMQSIRMNVSEAIRINPFRKPLMISSSDNDLPSCSNGFYCCSSAMSS